MNVAHAWTQDEIDADMERACEPDVCHHGIGFDEDCQWCDLEMLLELAEERRLKRLQKQPDLFESI